ncbi:MAG: hypothetical protein ACTSRG_22525 [Candidatus Helarchaeota archaeon]
MSQNQYNITGRKKALNDQISNNEKEVKKRFTTQDIAVIAAFIAILNIIEMIWVFGTYFWYIIYVIYGILIGIFSITAALVVGKRYTILVIGIVNTILNLFFAHMYGGTLVAFTYLIDAAILEAFLFFSKPYGGNWKLDVFGRALGALVCKYYTFIIWYINGLTYPMWFVTIGLTIWTLSFAIGGYLGYRFGNKIKPVITSI